MGEGEYRGELEEGKGSSKSQGGEENDKRKRDNTNNMIRIYMDVPAFGMRES